MIFSWLGRKNKNDFEENILSPKEKITCKVYSQDNKIYYLILNHAQQVLVNKSLLGVRFYREQPITDNLILVRKYHRVVGDAQEAVFYFSQSGSKKLITLRFRVFDDGVAFRYEIPAQPKMQRVIIAEEMTEFDIAKNNNDLEIGEAALYDYGQMSPKKNAQKITQANVTKMSDGTIARVNLPFETPWRIVGVRGNNLAEKLNTEPKRDFGWVKPIKAMGLWWAMVTGEWSWSANSKNYGTTLEHATEYIKKCKELGIHGLMIDGFDKEIARQANAEKISLICNLDLECDKNKMEQILRMLAINNVHYVRFNYVSPKYRIDDAEESWSSQAGVKYLQSVVEMAAKYHIMLEMPSVWKNTGVNKTWPNILARKAKQTQDEKTLEPSEICKIAHEQTGDDYFNGVFDLDNKNKVIHSTMTAQLARYVVFTSKIQTVIDRPEIYEKYLDEFSFVKNVPVVWNKSVVVAEQYGEYYIVARKSGTSWYVGGINNEKPRNVKVNFDFLGAGSYKAKIYKDGDAAHYQRNKMDMKITTQKINKNTESIIWMAAGGGFAMEITKDS